jgi:protein-S-isoprenylcysteine O-methyltransferase Ste14
MSIQKAIILISLLVLAAALVGTLAAPRLLAETTSKLVAFLAVSAALAYVSRASLRDCRSHGFPRFFAWEEILVLTLINLDVWFQDPLSWHQIISWFLLTVSLVLAIHGAQLLARIGKSDSRRHDTPMLEFEKTTTLVTKGAYRYIRHPLYSALLFLAWGVFFKNPAWIGGILALTASTFLVATARIEEAEDIHYFGTSYQDYMKQTKMFVPFLF